ncbi:DUF927 domain-containing protein [Ochrobactrum intermedium]|uniref:DUF927 domain-containing protein n=1 Tax=Brucella intermedia TaxID=94625 RepID=UPI00128E6DB6|nr:DUF927 domain-containing protein [Brucella intermedia]MPR64703.1 DUF927 domain-containing protein [Brucella intermedia]
MNLENTSNELRIVRQEIYEDTGNIMVTIEHPTSLPEVFKQTRVERGLLSNKQKLKSVLTDKGLPNIRDFREKVDRMLEQTDLETVTIVKKASWRPDGFICRYGFFPSEQVADAKVVEQVRFDPDNKLNHIASVRGKFSVYWAGLEEPLKYSSYLRLSLVAALAPPLAAFLGREGGVSFNISGESSRGKTLALRLNLSTVTNPSESALINPDNSDVFSTSNQSAFSGTCTPFADLKLIQGSENEVFKKLRLLTFNNNDGATRHTVLSTSSTSPLYSIQLFSSEEKLKDMFRSPKLKFENGNMVRLVDLPLPDNENGIFDLLKDEHGIEAISLFKQVKETIEKNYGRLFPRWIKRLSQQKREVVAAAIRETEELFLDNVGNHPKLKGKKILPQHLRVAEHFAFLAATARMAHRHKLLPEDYYRTMKKLCSVAICNMSQPNSEIVTKLNTFLAFATDHKNFPLVSKGSSVSQSEVQDGFRRDENGRACLFVYPKAMDRYVRINSEAYKRILDELSQRGAYIKPAEDAYTQTVLQAGLDKQRMLKFKLDKLK